jgi:hypothetical protein
MKMMTGHICASLVFLLAACSPETPIATAGSEALPAYVTLDSNLTQLKADFNSTSNKLRLVFISGPSCGICLRGMDDLNRSIVASLQNDPRVHTFVVYVPALGAEEKHVQAAIPLMTGPSDDFRPSYRVITQSGPKADGRNISADMERYSPLLHMNYS